MNIHRVEREAAGWIIHKRPPKMKSHLLTKVTSRSLNCFLNRAIREVAFFHLSLTLGCQLQFSSSQLLIFGILEYNGRL